MKKRILFLELVLLGLVNFIITIPAWGEVAFTRYKWGTGYASPGCCNSIYGQNYDCEGREIVQPSGRSCYNTGSGSTDLGTCGGGCITVACDGIPTKICVIDQPNIGCGNCDVFLEPLPGLPPSNCTSKVDPACAQRYGCGTPGGYTCYTQPYDASEDLDSGYLCDRRTPEMIATGCRPKDLDCVIINSFNADVSSINLMGGQGATFSGEISSEGDGLIHWILTVASKVFQGTGNSVLAYWDGKSDLGKQVSPGTYRARLDAHISGGACNGNDSKALQIAVKSTEQQSCPVDVNIEF